jgi:acyl-CoA dehydrogenase
MIDLELPDNLLQIRKTTHEFSKNVLRPVSRKYDLNEHAYPAELDIFRFKASTGGKKKPPEDPEKKGKKEGGVIGKKMIEAMAVEEMAWGDVGLMMSIPNNAPGNPALLSLASEEQLERFGGKWTAFSITEPETGSDSGSVKSTAVLDGDEWVLNGEKIFVTAAERCDNAIIWATVDQSAGKAGIKPFLVEKGTPGFEVVKLERKMGLRASDTGSFLLKDCRIPRSNILGEPDIRRESSEGFKGVMKSFDNIRPLVGIMATGISRAALDLLKEHLEQSGVPLDHEHAINTLSAPQKEYHMMEASLEALRLLSWRAFWMSDNGMPNSLEASMCKAKGGRTATLITQKCAELMGPLGLSSETLMEKWVRDAKILDIFEGTGQIQHLIIARRVLGASSDELK